MDGNFALAVILVVVVGTALAIHFRSDIVRTYFFEPLEQGRLFAGALLALLIVATWIRSGTPWKVVTSLLIVAFAVAFLVYEQPHRDIK